MGFISITKKDDSQALSLNILQVFFLIFSSGKKEINAVLYSLFRREKKKRWKSCYIVK